MNTSRRWADIAPGDRSVKHFVQGALLASFLSSAAALPAVAALKEGQTAPTFQAEASLAGKAFLYSLAEALKTGPVVVYF